METIDGLINLHKPPGITSAKALYKVRSITGMRKSGHTGTLDPGAEGVLVIAVGRATKLTEALMDQPKVYRARARLDVTSESFDSDRPLTPVPVATRPDEVAVRRVLGSFEGVVEQVPPAISALKVGGVPAYKLARRGVRPELEARRVTIYWVWLHRFQWPQIDFEMACGRGTYVRAVVRDLGCRLGVGGCLTALARTMVGPFGFQESWTLSRLETADPHDYILPLARAREWLDRRPIAIPERPG